MLRALLLALLVTLGLAGGASAREEIQRFTSEVIINVDGSLAVTETIIVNAEGREIRRGIYRDFPTIYRDSHGIRMRVGFEVDSVRHNGAETKYALENISNGRRVRIGDANVLLEPGLHTYKLRYRTTRQLGFFDDHDELYWNVTGNDWAFPILYANAVITLPAGAKVSDVSLYTGPQGSTQHNARVVSQDGGQVRAETTEELGPREGFTLSVSWQKGLVAEPTENDKRLWFIQDNAGIAGLLATLAGVFAYFWFAWSRVGRDPPKGTIVPLFSPPEGIGAGDARFIWKQGFDDRTMAAGLVGLAAKGRLEIEDDDGVFAVTRKQDTGPALSPSEAAFYSSLPSGRLVLRQANHTSVRSVLSSGKVALEKTYVGSVFVRNIGAFVKGALISIAGLVVSAFLMPLEEGIMGLFMAVFSGGWWAVVLGVAYGVLRKAFAQGGIMGFITSAGMLLFLIPFGLGGIIGPAAVFFSPDLGKGPGLILITGVLLGIMNWVFYLLLKAPTVAGRKLMDQIEGFRMYLSTAEEERLKQFHPPEKTPELFHKYLPYAMALDCENEWNAKFVSVLAAAAAAGAATQPGWYHGSNWSNSSGGFGRSLGSSLSSSVASSSSAPGSSSGGGGGGSSGGGGGGGGGGGW